MKQGSPALAGLLFLYNSTLSGDVDWSALFERVQPCPGSKEWGCRKATPLDYFAAINTRLGQYPERRAKLCRW